MLTTCPWCKEFSFGQRRNCKSCGHETYKSRLEYRCWYCSIRKQLDVTAPRREFDLCSMRALVGALLGVED